MIRKPEDSAVVKALPLEHRGRIVQRMGEDVHIGLAPWNQLAVKPDPSVAIVVRAFLKHDLILAASRVRRSEEHTSALQSLLRISYAVFCLKNKKQSNNPHRSNT